MSWFGNFENEQGFFESLCYKVIKMGQMPKHVAVIMDGNRRYAKKENISRKEGHTAGFDKLAQVLYWCHKLDIPEVTCYAFSIENFNRSKEEVDTLINIFNDKLAQLMKEKDRLMKYGVCIRFVGDISLFDLKIKKSVADVVEMTKNNNKCFLNIAMAYTSRDEIAQAVREVCKGVKDGLIKESDITESLLESCFYTNHCKPVDVLIRTSGEVRLSDFLLWQTSFSMLCFIDAYWPDLSLWHFIYCILKFQIGFDSLQNAKELSELKESRSQLDSDIQNAFIELKQNMNSDVENQELLQAAAKEYSKKRIIRQTLFLNRLEEKRKQQLVEWFKGEAS